MPDLFADAELFVITWATSALGVRALTDLPAGLLEAVPLIQVARFGGTDRARVLDRANIAVDSFGDSRSAAESLAMRVHAAFLHDLPGTVTGGTVVSRVATISAPAWRPYGNTLVRRFGASYQITLRTREVVTP